MIGNVLSPWHLMLILIFALIVFGPDKLPEVAQTVGKAIKEFKAVSTGLQKQLTEAMKIDDPPAASTVISPVMQPKFMANLDNAEFVQQILNNDQDANASVESSKTEEQQYSGEPVHQDEKQS